MSFNYFDYNSLTGSGQVLCDVSSSGNVRPWRDKKLKCEHLSIIYEYINPRKAERLSDCANLLIFNKTISGSLKLATMNSCRVRLCPMCAWRRSLKIFSNMSRIMDEVQKDNKLRYLFITLTVRNCSGDALSDTITDMMKGFQRFMQRKRVSSVIKGWYRGLEVTYNEKDNTFHPHFHCIFAVNSGYFKPGKYNSQSRWTLLWQEAMRLDYIPVVDVRVVYGDTAKAVSEVAKYSVKDSDFLFDDLDLSVDVVRVLDDALENRRLVAFGGLFKDVHKKLNLDDEVDGDLVHLSDDSLDPATEEKVVYFWNVGFGNYFKSI